MLGTRTFTTCVTAALWLPNQSVLVISCRAALTIDVHACGDTIFIVLVIARVRGRGREHEKENTNTLLTGTVQSSIVS